MPMINRDIFHELFVLELANNHWGSLERGLRIIRDFSTVVRYSNVRAAIKLQLRDVDSFVHKDFKDRKDIRYIKKTMETRLSKEDFAELVEAVRRNNCIRMATPFDEGSVDLCQELGIEIIKVASSDITDWVLLEKIARTRKPVIVSTGGASVRDMDAMVTFFSNRNIPLAMNHCVSLYPTEDSDLELNQIDYLRNRYPNVTIGLSTHEYRSWTYSIIIAYAKGARTFERHIDVDTPDHPISPYCSTPEQVRRVVRGVSQGEGDVRRKRPGAAPTGSQGGCLSGRAGAGGLRQTRPASGARAHRRRLLPRGPAAEGTDQLPRADQQRRADGAGQGGPGDHDRHVRQPVFAGGGLAAGDHGTGHVVAGCKSYRRLAARCCSELR